MRIFNITMIETIKLNTKCNPIDGSGLNYLCCHLAVIATNIKHSIELERFQKNRLIVVMFDENDQLKKYGKAFRNKHRKRK